MPSITRLNSQADALDQFKQFTEFARTSGGILGRTVVQVGGQLGPAGNGAYASISAKSRFDFIGNIGRRKQSKDENDDVRDLFKETVLKMCNCANEQLLPAKIREAMKFADYDKGKPLTARRILAVQEAVRQHALENTLNTAGIQLDDTIRDRIKTAVSACGSDPDAFAVLQESWKEVLFANAEQMDDPIGGKAPVPRGDWSVRSKASAIASDVQTLRQATGGDQVLFDAAKPYLALKGRAPLSSGLLTKMVQAVQQLQPSDLAPISALNGQSDRLDIHKAATKLSELIDNAMVASGLGKARGYLLSNREDYREQLLAGMILAKAIPNKGTLTAIQTVFRSPVAQKLKVIYTLGPQARPLPQDVHRDPLLASRSRVCFHFALAMNTLTRAVDQLCDGVLSPENVIELPRPQPGENLDAFNTRYDQDMDDLQISAILDEIDQKGIALMNNHWQAHRPSA